MPSSVRLGSRPRMASTRAYSSAVRPWSAASSGVTFISVSSITLMIRVSPSAVKPERTICGYVRLAAVGGWHAPTELHVMPAILCPAGMLTVLGGDAQRIGTGLPRQAFQHGAENHQAVLGAQRGFHRTLRMRHQAQHIALAVADPRDVGERAVGISRGMLAAFGRDVPEDDLTVALELSERAAVAEVVPLGVRDRELQHLTRLGGGCKRSLRGLYADVDLAAGEAQPPVGQHRARTQSCLQQGLKAVADAQPQPAAADKPLNRAHHRREPRLSGLCAAAGWCWASATAFKSCW